MNNLEEDERNKQKFTPSLEIKKVSKSFEGKKVLDNISLNFYPGKCYGIVGPNGSGKTTLMRIISGLSVHDEGDVLVKGRKPGDENYNIPLCWISCEPFFTKVLPKVSLNKILLDHKKFFGLSEKEVNKRISASSFKDKIESSPETLSTGWNKLFQIFFYTADLNTSQGLLIVDEPFNGLSTEIKIQAKKWIRNLVESGSTVIISSHNMEYLKDLVDDIIMLKNKTVVYNGSFPENFEKTYMDTYSDSINKNSVEGIF